jgi:hypothetical protein
VVSRGDKVCILNNLSAAECTMPSTSLYVVLICSCKGIEDGVARLRRSATGSILCAREATGRRRAEFLYLSLIACRYLTSRRDGYILHTYYIGSMWEEGVGEINYRLCYNRLLQKECRLFYPLIMTDAVPAYCPQAEPRFRRLASDGLLHDGHVGTLPSRYLYVLRTYLPYIVTIYGNGAVAVSYCMWLELG